MRLYSAVGNPGSKVLPAARKIAGRHHADVERYVRHGVEASGCCQTREITSGAVHEISR